IRVSFHRSKHILHSLLLYNWKWNFFSHRLTSILKHVTVGPCLFLNHFGVYTQSVALQSLLLPKICDVRLGLNEIVCNNLDDFREEEKLVQRQTSNLILYSVLIVNLPVAFLITFLGLWSDKYGRKLLIVLSLLGTFLQSESLQPYSETFVAIRSRLLKLVAVDEVGKLYGILTQFQSLTPLFAGALFTQLYKKTLTFLSCILCHPGFGFGTRLD
ncbi:uncharacterized protein LOC111087032, partial [Limulus polyphemus]|uniref:Uncharacterized protein LOC111087032 n=1 Tax=Limulus polyphemus TaxID=6850 RepID=A0ABM1SW87_LIMPO